MHRIRNGSTPMFDRCCIYSDSVQNFAYAGVIFDMQCIMVRSYGLASSE